MTVIGLPEKDKPDREEWRGVRFRRVPQTGQLLEKVPKTIRYRERLRGLARLFKSSNPEPAADPPAESPREPAGRVVENASSMARTGVGRHLANLRARWEGIMQWRQWIRVGLDEHADVYHAHDLDTLYQAMTCARRRRAKLVYDSHELWIDWKYNKLGDALHQVRNLATIEEQGSRIADLVITVSEGIADELVRLYRIARPLVLRNVAAHTPLVRSNKLRESIGGDPARTIALYQGGFAEGRSLMELLDVARSVPDADFVFMGPESTFKQRMVAQARDLPNAHFLPGVSYDELLAFTCSADVGFVLTQPACLSYKLSLSNKVFEYMMAGLPIIASTIQSHRDLADETGALALADPGDAIEIARAVRQLLDHPAKRKAMGQQAREWAERKYNANLEMAKLVAAYQRLADGTANI